MAHWVGGTAKMSNSLFAEGIMDRTGVRSMDRTWTTTYAANLIIRLNFLSKFLGRIYAEPVVCAPPPQPAKGVWRDLLNIEYWREVTHNGCVARRVSHRLISCHVLGQRIETTTHKQILCVPFDCQGSLHPSHADNSALLVSRHHQAGTSNGELG